MIETELTSVRHLGCEIVLRRARRDFNRACLDQKLGKIKAGGVGNIWGKANSSRDRTRWTDPDCKIIDVSLSDVDRQTHPLRQRSKAINTVRAHICYSIEIIETGRY